MVARFRFALVASTALAFAAGLPVLGLAQAAPGQGGQGQVGQNQVDQGQPVAAAPAPATSGGGVTVMKGNPPPKAPPAEQASPEGVDQSGDAIMMGSGGRHMWMVDRANGQVTDCQSRETSTPGQPAIDCATRPLPVPGH